MPLQKINCYHCAAAASSSFQFARALRSRCHQEFNMLHEIITGIGACLWSLGCFSWISATLVCAGICCFTQPLLNGILREAVHYLGGSAFQSCGIQETLSPPALAVGFRNDFSISICSVSAADTASAHRCVQTSLSTGAVVYWLPEVPGEQKTNTADIAACSSQQLGMFEDTWRTNFHRKCKAGEQEPVPKMSAGSRNHSWSQWCCF